VTPRVRTAIAVALAAAGVLVWLLGLLADPLGLGGVVGFNRKQVFVAELGAAAVLAGVLWSARAPRA
jgi:hypothetical protein